jgi:D-alanyl-lipoteichoic acid acyltransferase DltB (MBOAT superfamily)
MSFTSLYFYLCLFPAVVIFYACPARWRVPYLLGASCAFYLTHSIAYFLLLAVATALVFGVGLRLSSAKTDQQRMRLLLLGLVPVLGVLVLFKLLGITNNVLIPIGLSYYSFKLISYLVEIYWDEGQVERSWLRFAAFSTFGAQMVSGPIQRPYQFLPQLDTRRFTAADFACIESGFRLILGGLLLKLAIGDHLGAFIGLIDQNPEKYSWPVVAVSTLCYMPYLFADFAGYTNIAIGIGRLFGIDSPPNFAAPFAASNMQDFWRRWHMSLTSWLVDYVFTPLRIRLRHWGRSGLLMSLMTNMILIGIWHGFTWTFLIFGVFHGIVMVISVLTLKPKEGLLKDRPALRRIDHVIGIATTFLIMTFSQIFFQAASLEAALHHLRLVLALQHSGSLGFADIPADILAPVALCAIVSGYVGFGMPGTAALAAKWSRIVPNWLSYGLALFLLSACMNEAGSHFIYGQF